MSILPLIPEMVNNKSADGIKIIGFVLWLGKETSDRLSGKQEFYKDHV